MPKNVTDWLYAAGWVLLVSAFGVAYAVGEMTLGTLVFSEGCMVAVGAICFIFTKKTNASSETIEEILDRTEHPTHS